VHGVVPDLFFLNYVYGFRKIVYQLYYSSMYVGIYFPVYTFVMLIFKTRKWSSIIKSVY